MPRAITVPSDAPGIATYKLSGLDEFAVLAVTFAYNQGASILVNGIFLDCRAPSGQTIYSQLVDYTDNDTRYSLATGSESTYAPDGNTGRLGWPQSSGGSGGYASERLSPITLSPLSTLNVYASSSPGTVPPPDPITNIDAATSIEDLVLWVEDTGRGSVVTVIIGPYQLVPGSGA